MILSLQEAIVTIGSIVDDALFPKLWFVSHSKTVDKESEHRWLIRWPWICPSTWWYLSTKAIRRWSAATDFLDGSLRLTINPGRKQKGKMAQGSPPPRLFVEQLGWLINATATTVSTQTRRAWDFVVPTFESHPQPASSVSWHQMLHEALIAHSNNTFTEFLLRHLDANGDGSISSTELLNLTDVLYRHYPQLLLQLQHPTKLLFPNPPASFSSVWVWFSREWPLMDWKLGVFLWRTFGSTLLVLALLSVVPGRMHSISARILRWPVLGLTYFLVTVELGVYVIIRLFIRLTEHVVARPKHRALRRLMARATSYQEWYRHASDLDASQKRDVWLRQVNDSTGYSYNWGFILELMKDLRNARHAGDSLLALAVIQQCTRKNVGGVMNEDLFSYTNTGEPKLIVRNFIDETVTTLQWITDEAVRSVNSDQDAGDNGDDRRTYDERFQQNVRGEKDKLWKLLVDLVANSAVTNGGGGASLTSGSSRSSRRRHHRTGSNGSLASDGSSVSSHSERPAVAIPSKALPSFHREQVLTFLKRARAAYGRTALCLSGGAMLGLYHFGVVTALHAEGLLPHIISGTSAGSVVGAILCTRTDDELKSDLRPEVLVEKLTCFSRPWKDRIFKGILKNGNMFLEEDWIQLIQWFTKGDTTFLEAYRRTGRVFCITLSSTSKKSPPVLLNYLSAPNVVIASAVIASAAVPGFISPVRLRVKDDTGVVRFQGGGKDETFWDGSIQADLPTKGLSDMLNCQFFIASQCNPHIAPFFFNPKGGVGMPSRWTTVTKDGDVAWRGGFLLAALEMYLKTDMKAKMCFLNDVEAAVGFTSTMMTQDFVGSTTIVPRMSFVDFFKLFKNPSLDDLYRYFQEGAVAAYGHMPMISLHYSIADVLDECIAKLEGCQRLSEMKRLSRNGSADNPGLVAELLRTIKFERDNGSMQSSDLEDEDEYEQF
jgi:predicted acylesterase/phospholipase RssA